MKKILIALVGLGFISTLCFAAENTNTMAAESAKPAETKMAVETKTPATKTETAKKGTAKAKKGKKVSKKKAEKDNKKQN